MPSTLPALRRFQTGITLIEALICACLLILLVTFAGPPLHEMMTSHRALSAEHALMSQLQLARTTAVVYRQDVVLCPSLSGHTCSRSNDWNTGWLLFVDADGNRHPDTKADIIRADSLAASAHLRLVGSAGRSFIRYLPDGRSAGTNLTVSICSSNGQVLRQVIVSNAGRARGQRPKVPRDCPN